MARAKTLYKSLWVVFFAFVSVNVHGQQSNPEILLDTLIKGQFLKSEVKKTNLYVPINVPDNVTAFTMSAIISDPDDNVLDIGVFDERGIELGPGNGFRGWAGGVSSKQVRITREAATPSYIPGPIHKGVWHVLLVPARIKADKLEWQLKVRLEKSADALKDFVMYPARETVHNKEGWYRGDLHLHDENSDGVYTQANLVKNAKASGLDFMVSTNHNTNAANLNWGNYDTDSLLILNGEEVTPFEENHWNAIGIKPETWVEWRYNAASGKILQYQQQVRNAGGLCVINHPFYDTDSILDTRFPVNGFDAIEVWNGPWEIRDQYGVEWWNGLLKKGIRKTAIGASDFHRPGSDNVLANPHTVVHATGLNRKAIIEGIREGRCYIAQNPKIALRFTSSLLHSQRFAEIGDSLQTNVKSKLKTVVRIMGIPDNCKVIIISNKGIEKEFVNVKNGSHLTCIVPATHRTFLRAEVRTKDGMMQALTNPIWIRH